MNLTNERLEYYAMHEDMQEWRDNEIASKWYWKKILKLHPEIFSKMESFLATNDWKSYVTILFSDQVTKAEIDFIILQRIFEAMEPKIKPNFKFIGQKYGDKTKQISSYINSKMSVVEKKTLLSKKSIFVNLGVEQIELVPEVLSVETKIEQAKMPDGWIAVSGKISYKM